MRSFASKGVLFLLINLAVALGVLHLARSNQNDFMAATIDKHRRLQSLEGSARLILVGGSGMAFGADSSLLTDVLNVPVQNMGLSAALGLRFMLDEAGGVAQRGDTLLLSFAYQQFVFDNATGAALWRLLVHRPESFSYVTWPTFRVLLDEGLNGLGTTVRAGVRGVFARPAPPYSRGSFNRFGDIVGHASLPSPAIAHYEFRFYRAQPGHEEAALQALAEFCRRMRWSGVQVLYAHPPIPEMFLTRHRATIERVVAGVAAVDDLTVVAEPWSQQLPDEAFFDTAYHLTVEGMRARTEFLLPRLRPLVNRADAAPR